MQSPTDDDNETWIIEFGDEIIQKKSQNGFESLNDYEQLVFLVWIADFSIRNAGDLVSGKDIRPGFKQEILSLARKLSYSVMIQAFDQPDEDLIENYYNLFDSICDELRKA
ncbi:MAG: hypothetical protein HUJ26_06410 [Planctomycetaceae bacterium]|nr:hypothetical protein [Planctomycetaceae bacterium]